VDLVNGFGYRPLENNKHVGRRSFLQGRETGRRGIRRGSLLLPRASVAMVLCLFQSIPPTSDFIAFGAVCGTLAVSVSERMNSSAVAAYNVSRLTVVGECSEEEVRHLEECSDKGLVVARWISEPVSRSCLEGLITVPPPILSRCYQEISNGMLGFNQAFRVTLVPFPFPFAQLLALLLLVFVVICPTMVVKMTVGKILSPVLSFFAVLGYWGLNQIAVELENPFGDDKNDLPLEHVHTAFVDGIHDCAFAGLAETGFADGRRSEQGPAPTAPAEVAPTRTAPSSEVDPLVIRFNQELAAQCGVPAEHLFSRRLRFCDLLLFRECDLAVRLGNETLGREIFRRVRVTAARHGISPRQPRLVERSAAHEDRRPSLQPRRPSDASSGSPGNELYFSQQSQDLSWLDLAWVVASSYISVLPLVMNPPGVSYPPPPGYTHAQ
ncbi:Zinc finger, RAN-binding domain containing 2, partial [Perkinsus olseni]